MKHLHPNDAELAYLRYDLAYWVTRAHEVADLRRYDLEELALKEMQRAADALENYQWSIAK